MLKNSRNLKFTHIQVQGYYVATGFSGQGLALAGGAGNLVAGLVCGETLPVDITRQEVTRFIDLHASPQYLIERVPEVAGIIQYSILP